MVEQGLISWEEASNHPNRHVITRALGSDPTVEVAVSKSPIEITAGDLFSLCSDGLSNMVEDKEIWKIATRHDPQEACRHLVDLANERGGPDNITVQIIKIERAPWKEGVRERLLSFLKNPLGKRKGRSLD